MNRLASLTAYPWISNRIDSVTLNDMTIRQFSYDAAGNITSDARLGSVYEYDYNNAGQIRRVMFEGTRRALYSYNGLRQLSSRTVENMGVDNGTTHFIHDLWGNVIAETDGTGAAGSTREYIWIPEAGYAGVSLPIATVEGVNTADSALYYTHTDHLSRPVMMTDGVKAVVWQASWSPFGRPHTITGSLTENRRFPGQWFQLEAGIHYNWHRHYDPTIGRYTSPDPLGFVDGPSVYGYVNGNPIIYIDPDGRVSQYIGAAAIGARAVYRYCKRLLKDFLKDDSGAVHRTNRSKSNKPKHEKGNARRDRDRGGEKGDARRRNEGTNPNKRPKGHKGKWP